MCFQVVERLCNWFKSDSDRGQVQVEIENKRRCDEAQTYCHPDIVVDCWSYGLTGCSDLTHVYLTKSSIGTTHNLLCIDSFRRWSYVPKDAVYKVKHGDSVSTVKGYRRYTECPCNKEIKYREWGIIECFTRHVVPLHIIEAHLRAEVPDMTCYVRV